MSKKIINEQKLEDLVKHLRAAPKYVDPKAEVPASEPVEPTPASIEEPKADKVVEPKTTPKIKPQAQAPLEPAQLAVGLGVAAARAPAPESGQELKYLAGLMRDANYPKGCTDFVLRNWKGLAGMTLWSGLIAWVVKSKLLTSYDFLVTAPKTAFDALLPGIKSQLKKRFPDKFKSLNEPAEGAKFSKIIKNLGSVLKNNPKKTIGGVAALGITAAALDNIADEKVVDDSMRLMGDLAKTPLDVIQVPYVIPYKLFKDELGGDEAACAPLVYGIIAGVSSILTLAIAKPFRPIKYATDKVQKIMKKANDDAVELQLAISNRVNQTAGRYNGPAKETITNIAENYGSISREQAKKQLEESLRASNAPTSQWSDAEKFVDLIYDEADGVWKSYVKTNKAKALTLAKQADEKLRDITREAQQMGFGFDEIPDSSVPNILRSSDEAFEIGNTTRATASMKDIYQFYYNKGLLDDAIFTQQLDTLVGKIRSDLAKTGEVSETAVMLRFLDEATKKLPAVKIKELDSALSKYSQVQIPEAEVVKQLEGQVDDVIKHNTSNLQDVDREQVEQIRKNSLDKVKELYNNLKTKHPKKAAATIAVSAFASLFVPALFVRKQSRPTGSPYYFDDDSAYSFLNSVTGQKDYLKIRNEVLGRPKARRDFMSFIFNPQNSVTRNYIEKLSKENKAPINPKKKADDVLKDFAQDQKFQILDKLDELYPRDQDQTALYGTTSPEIRERKQEVMFTLISELFLYNSAFQNLLEDYYEKVIPSGAGPNKRKEVLGKIFSLRKSYLTSSAEKISDIDRFYSNDFRKSSAAGVSMSPGQSGSSVADVAVREFNNWPSGKTENSDDTLDFLERYLKDSRAIGKNLSKDQVKNWVETNIRNPEQGKKPYAWSAVFLRSVTKQAGQELPSERGMLASHKGYVEAAKKNTLKPGGPDEGEWFYLPMEKPLPALGDQSLRSDGITNKSINYEPQNGDIIITTGGRDSGYHGDILTSKGRIGGNVSDAIGIRSPSKPMHGIVTNNPKAREQLLNKLTAQGIKEMSKKDIKQLVAEVLNESYAKYPYNANEYSEEEPDQDYMVEWKALVEEVCGMKRKNIDGDPKTMEDAAVEVAKLFVKDSDLFREVLEMAGSNKSIGVEILQQLKAAREKKNLDKELNV